MLQINKVSLLGWSILLILLIGLVSNLQANEPDRYFGDTAIYYSSGGPPPNVLFVLDNSRFMANYSGGGLANYVYDPVSPYSGNETSTMVMTSNNYISYSEQFDIAKVDCIDENGVDVEERLLKFGTYWGSLIETGAPANRGQCNVGGVKKYYFLGDYVNYLKFEPVQAPVWQPNTPYVAGDMVRPTAESDIFYTAISSGTSASPDMTQPVWSEELTVIIVDGEPVADEIGLKWKRADTFLSLIQALFNESAVLMKDEVKLGVMIYGSSNQGGRVWSPVRDLNQGNNMTSFTAQVEALSGLSISTAANRPMNETLYDAIRYFQGNDNASQWVATNDKNNPLYDHPSPIEYYCESNHVIVITTGSAHQNTNAVYSLVGGDGNVSLVAKYAFENDLRSDLEGDQVFKTHVIQLGSGGDNLLEDAAKFGEGMYEVAENYEELAGALKAILESIVLTEDTIFVAPVVPANPENRTYSGDRVYLGLFRPENDQPWRGNLKKFGLKEINGQLEIMNAMNADGETLATNENGNFEASSTSYWSPAGDNIEVSVGGAGAKIISSASAGSRSVWTMIGGVEASFDNSNISTEMLGVADDTERDELIDFIRGKDVFEQNETPNSEVRPWIMGDVLHSRPLVLNYGINPANDTEQTYVFVGTNGGLLHAIKDGDTILDGTEEWAFIPPELLPRLNYLTDWKHTYLVDGSPSVYTHDADDNKFIGDPGDLAILLFGLRRGGGWQNLDARDSDDQPLAHGAYYAINVTDPENPSLLWSIDSNTLVEGNAVYRELAQTWSQPQLARVKVGLETKIVAFVGAGYDNVEDLRFGSTDDYPTTRLTGPTPDFSTGKSDGTVDASVAVTRGRGVYAIEIATLGADGLDTNNSGNPLWDFSYQDTDVNGNPITHSVPSDVLIYDSNGDGFANRVYFGDMGGNIWRVDLTKNNNTDNLVSAWTTTKIFSANLDPEDETVETVDATTGRKFFYRPDITVLDSNNVMLYFGSGDRAHPLNNVTPGAVIDRLYAVRDSDEIGYYTDGPLRESNLHDVTENVLQQEQADIQTELALITAAKGWYIRLDYNAGEKVTAPATLFNDVVYFTTFQPERYVASGDPCASSDFNLGTARLYAIDALTGEAVFNFYTESVPDQYGESQDTADVEVLRRADRELAIGRGIPPGVVVVITEGGSAFLLMVIEGEDGIYAFDPRDEDWRRTRSLYWMQW